MILWKHGIAKDSWNFLQYPMPALILSFFCGVMFLQLFASLPNLSIIIGITVAIVLTWYFSNGRWRLIFKFLSLFALGFLWMLFRINIITSWFLPQEMEGKNVIVTGFISSLPDANERYASFTFDTLSISGKKQKTKLRLNWYTQYPKISVGDEWNLEVKLKKPHGTLNPGGFDFEKYLFQHAIRATGYVISGDSNYLIKANKYQYSVSRVRQSLRAKIFQFLDNRPLVGIINTLVIGDQSGISKEQWQIFRDTGTSYLMAISGLHISFIGILAFMLTKFIWRCFPSLMLWMPTLHAASVFAFIAALIYSVLSGFSIPTQRALIMLAVFTIFLLLRRNITTWNVLILSLLIVLLISPLAILSEGFWLSFFAVGFIIYITKGSLNTNSSWWRNYFKIQLGIILGLSPFTLLFFQQTSFVAFFASMLALPAVCFVIVPISLIGSLFLLINFHYGGYFLLAAEKITELVVLWLQWLAAFSWSNWFHPVFNWWVLVTAFVGAILLLAPSGFATKWLGIIWLLPLFFYKPVGPKYGEIWFTLLDVGQGLSAVIRTQNHIMIYDTGPKFLDTDAGETIVVPFLRYSSINMIDTMVVSHGDDDHSGGAYSILKLLKVKKVISSVPEKFLRNDVAVCSSEQSWRWDGVNFIFINSVDELLSSNDASCVLKIDNGSNSILLAGDIEKSVELWLVNNKLTDLAATILVAPHHGSRTSSSPKFIQAVGAKYVLFSTGYRNRFNFPSKAVVNRYLQRKTKLFDTAKFGAILFKLNYEPFVAAPLLYRITDRHYWNFSD